MLDKATLLKRLDACLSFTSFMCLAVDLGEELADEEFRAGSDRTSWHKEAFPLVLFRVPAQQIANLRLLLWLIEGHHLRIEQHLLVPVLLCGLNKCWIKDCIIDSRLQSGIKDTHHWLVFDFVPQIEEIFVECGADGDIWRRPAPIRVHSLLPLLLLDLLVVLYQSSFALIRVRLGNEAAESFKVCRFVHFLLTHLRRSHEARVLKDKLVLHLLSGGHLSFAPGH